ncbi:MAG: hypothetical protein IKG62_04635, partial [Lachnospiraceae bacterium]|nr:hypothetical protein [Lachnospiraceae bacterium]
MGIAVKTLPPIGAHEKTSIPMQNSMPAAHFSWESPEILGRQLGERKKTSIPMNNLEKQTYSSLESALRTHAHAAGSRFRG